MTPMDVSLGRPFPLLVNQSLVACVQLAGDAEQAATFRRYSVRPHDRSDCRLPAAENYGYLLLEDAVRLHVQEFFGGKQIEDCTFFRVTRNADMSVQEDSAADLLAGMEQVLDGRKQSACVRLEIADKARRNGSARS